jgi:AcrR family transcriptional regulator
VLVETGVLNAMSGSLRETGRASLSRGPAREQAILSATAQLVAELGYDRVTVNAIAARAHASKATMYRRWPGKAELVAEALRQHAEGGVAEIPDTGSLRGDLLFAVGSIASTLTAADGGPSLPGLAEAIRTDAVLRELIRVQIDERGHQDGLLICRRAAARAEAVDERLGPVVLGLAVAHLFLRTMLDGEAPHTAERETFVDRVLLPLLTHPGVSP